MDPRARLDSQTVGERIRARREALGYTQEELARRIVASGVPFSQSYLSRLEKGDYCTARVGVERAHALERHLELEMGSLFDQGETT